METAETAEKQPGFRSLREVLGAVKSAMGFLAGVDMGQLPGECLAEVLTVMEQVDAAQAAVRGATVQVFNDKHIHSEFGHRATTGWLKHYTGVTRGKASQVSGLAAFAHHHPLLIAALAEQDAVSESFARQIGQWTDQFPDEAVQRADEILIEACRKGASLGLLAELAAEIRAMVCQPDPEQEKDKLTDRSLKLETTMGGAGVLRAGLTPGCAALFGEVLAILGRRNGKDDNRSKEERDHDALEQACKLLLGSKAVSKRHGRPYGAVVHIGFEDLLSMQGASVLVQAYTEQVAARWQQHAEDARARWTGRRAGETITGGDGGTWLEGDRALQVLPDAMMIPVVTGHVAVEYLNDIVDIAIQIRHLETEQAGTETGRAETGQAKAGSAAAAAQAAELLELRQALVGKAIALVSGPDKLASWLRQTLLGDNSPGLAGTPLAGALSAKSVPLDVGMAKNVPHQLRLVTGIRDPRCQAPGCDQAASQCEPHHLCHREDGGRTCLDNLSNLCWWHHHILIHTMGWTARLNGDGTVTFRKPDGTTMPNGPPR
jgi:Domain of unknown function (DUF222)